MEILAVGAGAVGGYFGGRLAQANRDVTFLVRAKRAEEIKANGLQIVSPHGNVTLRPKTTTASQLSRPCDLILLGVKSYALSGAMSDFAPAVGPITIILPLLNGMRYVDLLTARFGKAAVLGGVCIVATELDEQGRILQLADFQTLSYGELDGKNAPRLEKLDATLRGAGFGAAISSNILQDMWEKWVQIAAVGIITCLMRGNVGEVVSIPGGADLSRSAVRECAEIASACGHRPSDEFLGRQIAQVTAQGSQSTSSMYRDLKKEAPVEVDAILGDLLELGRSYGLTTPILQAAFVNLSIYQRGRDHAKSAIGD